MYFLSSGVKGLYQNIMKAIPEPSNREKSTGMLVIRPSFISCSGLMIAK